MAFPGPDDTVQMSNESAAYAALDRFHSSYKAAHPYLSISICACGILMNAANAVVLTRPAMGAKPMNVLLTMIAITDAVLMSTYVPFTVWNTGLQRDLCSTRWTTYGWAVFVLAYSIISVICHAVSIWLTVCMASIRAYTIRPSSQRAAWSTKKSYALATAVVATVVLLYIPGILSYTVVPNNSTNCYPNSSELLNGTASSYRTWVSPLGSSSNSFLLKLTFWTNGVLFKLVPCIMLSVFIGVLLNILADVKRRKRRLFEKTNNLGNGRRCSADTTRTDRTTSMLVVLLLVFLMAELPQGLLMVTAGLSGHKFRSGVIKNLGDLMDLISLLNSAVNFVIYCAMSQRFREVFCRTFLPFLYGLFHNHEPSLYATDGYATPLRSYRSNSCRDEFSATNVSHVHNGSTAGDERGRRISSATSTALLRPPSIRYR